MLEFHAVKQRHASPSELVPLLQQAKALLQERGMASMDEYGDMLQWALPRQDGVWRKFHVFHPDWCSFDDRFWGTIHYHAGWIRGTLLVGSMEHYTYRAEARADGDRFLNGQAYRLTKHTDTHAENTVYELPAKVPHWIKPTALTLTYFEEQETDEVSDLINPASEEIDEHRWTQEQAEALLPELIDIIDAKIARLSLVAP